MPALKPPTQQTIKSLFVESVGTTATAMPWFVSSTQAPINGIRPYVPRKGFIDPLINGQETFGAVEKAIRAATKSIDYITWGFDPSMRFSDGGKSVGQLLQEAAARGVKVRLLFWYGGYLSSSMIYGQSDGGKTATGNHHATANLPGYDKSPGEAFKYTTSAEWYKQLKKNPNIELRLRSMNSSDVGDAITKHANLKPIGTIQEQGLKKAATHHQKMVLVDYAFPQMAKGFVLGSNTLPRYWDTNDHPIEHDNRRMDFVDVDGPINSSIDDVLTRIGSAADRRTSQARTTASVKFGPWQDISISVGGAVLFDLHANFASAWQQAGGTALEAQRDNITPEALTKAQDKPNVAMQVVRTQPQEGDHSISDVYFQNVRNARRYIYFENQYFRLSELTQELDKIAGKLSAWGRKDNLYVFVVTNVPDDYGRLNTYEMLAALGKGEQMPQMHAYTQEKPKKAIQPLPSTKRNEAGLKSVICTLTACEGKTPKDLRYAPIYVHSKLMAIDDHFFTLGSANLNARSMVSDSELNVAVPSDTQTKELRTKLWGMHRGVQLEDGFATEFEKWGDVAKDNLRSFKTQAQPLIGHLTQFNDEGPVVHLAYD